MTTIQIDITIPDHQLGAFLNALTGHDDDVILAAEKGIRERLDTDPAAHEQVELSHGRFLDRAREAYQRGGLIAALQELRESDEAVVA